MSTEENNKAIVVRWFTDFWGKTRNLGIVDELASPDMLLQYSLHAPRKGLLTSRRSWAISARPFRTSISGAPPISLPRATMWSAVGKAAARTRAPRSAIFSSDRCLLRPAGNALYGNDGRIVEEIGLDDGVTALQRLGLIKAA